VNDAGIFGYLEVREITQTSLGKNSPKYAQSAKVLIGTSLDKWLDSRSLMSCNVGQYLPTDESPVAEVEWIVHLKMIAQQGRRRGRGRGHFLPPQNVELIVTTREGHTLHLTGYCLPDLEECYLDLQQGRLVLRKFHAHEGHINPMRRNHPIARIHMHFPSIKFPLIESRSSYAYSIDEDGFADVADCLKFFCAELSIDLGGWQPYLRPY